MTQAGSYILPLLAALAYTFSTLFFKQALSLGAGTMRVVFVTNFLAIPFFIPILIWNHCVLDWSFWPMLLLCALFNTLAMALTFITIKIGDISIQTPVMGSKVIMVAFLSIWMGMEVLNTAVWIASFLSVLAICILGKPDKLSGNNKTLLLTVCCSLLTALSFAISDTLMAKYAAQFGEGPFLMYTMILTAIFSCGLIPFFEGKLVEMPKVSWFWVFWGGVCMSLELIFYCYALAFYSNPTTINILYSSRGIWSVLLIWLMGGYFGNTESQKGKSIMLQRLAGALVLFMAIILVIASK